MKLFLKLLTLASIAVTGTAALADNSAVLEQNYTAYREAYNELKGAAADEDKEYLEGTLHEALGALKKVCNSKCTRFSCGKGSEMGKACAKYCTYQGNCLQKFNKAIISANSFKNYLSKIEKLKKPFLDENGVPMAPLPTTNSEEGMDKDEEAYQPTTPAKKPSLARQSSTRQLTRPTDTPVLTSRQLTGKRSAAQVSLDDVDDEETARPVLKRKSSVSSNTRRPLQSGVDMAKSFNGGRNSLAMPKSSSADVDGTMDGEACVCSLKGLAPASVAPVQTTVVKANDNAPAPAPQQKAPDPTPPVEAAPTPPAPVAAPAPASAPAKTPCELAGEANGMSADDAAANGLC
jgi:hypothetical protein